jgi:hypothetical protein
MERERTSAAPILLAVVVVVSVVLGAYTVAYFLRGACDDYVLHGGMSARIRSYHTAREAKFFSPAARVESLVTGLGVSTREVPEISL